MAIMTHEEICDYIVNHTLKDLLNDEDYNNIPNDFKDDDLLESVVMIGYFNNRGYHIIPADIKGVVKEDDEYVLLMKLMIDENHSCDEKLSLGKDFPDINLDDINYEESYVRVYNDNYFFISPTKGHDPYECLVYDIVTTLDIHSMGRLKTLIKEAFDIFLNDI